MKNYLEISFPKQELTKNAIDHHLIIWMQSFKFHPTNIICSRNDYDYFNKLTSYQLYHRGPEEGINYGTIIIIHSDQIKDGEWFLVKQNKRFSESIDLAEVKTVNDNTTSSFKKPLKFEVKNKNHGLAIKRRLDQLGYSYQEQCIRKIESLEDVKFIIYAQQEQIKGIITSNQKPFLSLDFSTLNDLY